MKKHFIYALMSAIALTGTVSFSSCSSTAEEAGPVNPGYDPATDEVPVQFALNFSLGNTPSTRQGEANVQALPTNTFRGIQNAHIMTFNQVGKKGQFLMSPTMAVRDYDMAQVAGASTISSDQSRRVLEMTLPLKTNTMVFYGRANKEEDKELFGHLDDSDGYGVSSDLNATSFHLGKRLSATNKPKFQQTQKLLAGIMTCIMNVNRGNQVVNAGDTPDNAENIPTYGFSLAADLKPNMTWSEYLDDDGKIRTKSPVTPSIDLTQLEEKLARAYKELTTIQEAELRNGSSAALKSTTKNLWSIVNSVRCATPTSTAEAFAKYMANLINEELKKYFTYEKIPYDGGSVKGVNIKSENVILTAFLGDSYWPTEAGDKPAATDFSAISAITGVELSTFPETYFLPQGSAHIKFDRSKKSFYYVENYNTSAVGGAAFTVDDYYFPPELLYFGNSPIRVSDDEHVVAEYPESTTLWHKEPIAPEDKWYGWEYPGEVESSTRSVAMRNDINYGTALLKTTVGYTSEISDGTKTLKDNNHAIQLRDYTVEEADNEIVPTGASFILKGILIGGQSPRVGWNFLPALKTDADHPENDEYQGYVFDSKIANNGSIPASGNSDPNYTLVFDNYNSKATATNQDRVFVALELMNNTGMDFMGKDNLIADQSNFYLIGQLDPTDAQLADLVWPTYHALPPYEADATTGEATMKGVKRVFIQDYMTTVNFKIGEHSLKYAYLTVPDLRSSSVTLGLSVDMKWSTGLDFGDVVLGGTEGN